MKRRRITALALSAMMVGTMLAGCGTKSEAPAGGESAVQTEAGEKKETTGRRRIGGEDDPVHDGIPFHGKL